VSGPGIGPVRQGTAGAEWLAWHVWDGKARRGWRAWLGMVRPDGSARCGGAWQPRQGSAGPGYARPGGQGVAARGRLGLVGEVGKEGLAGGDGLGKARSVRQGWRVTAGWEWMARRVGGEARQAWSACLGWQVEGGEASAGMAAARSGRHGAGGGSGQASPVPARQGWHGAAGKAWCGRLGGARIGLAGVASFGLA
jgi:hypothetical protein